MEEEVEIKRDKEKICVWKVKVWEKRAKLEVNV